MKRITTAYLARLFERRERPGPLPLKQELAAVARGEKPIAVYSFDRATIEEVGDGYADVCRAALDARLILTLVPRAYSARDAPVYVFVHGEGDAWRVHAWLATRLVLRDWGWSDGLEVLESTLLGYTDQQIERWMDVKRARQVAWQVPTVYLHLSDACRADLEGFGQRSFPPGLRPGEKLTLFTSRGRKEMRPGALARCLLGFSVGRVSLNREAFDRLFLDQLRTARRDVARVDVAATEAGALNKELESKIQFLTIRGWV